MAKRLRALVLGSGFAGQGHALALRDCGVEVAAMASRTEEVVKRVASSLDIPVAMTDWRGALREVRPDIVAVGTPGGTHLEMASTALDAGCHVFCDKPLATTAQEARQLYVKARAAGVKTAFAASFMYQPAALLARELVRQGTIGQVYEVECVSHYNLPALMPFGWPHRLSTGGGRLNNNFTHKLAIVLHVTGGVVLAAAGETRNDMKKAPVGPHVHDFRQLRAQALSPQEAAGAQWREVDSDWSYTVLARIGAPGTDYRDGISALFKHSGLRAGNLEDYVAFYGSAGTIHIKGAYAQGPLRLWRGQEWEEVPVPRRILESLPAIVDDTQRNWTQLARDFVADIRGEGYRGYLTFKEGWLFQEIIDIARAAAGWTPLPLDACWPEASSRTG